MELGSTNLPELDPFAEFSTLVSGDELADQSLPDEEYLQSFTSKVPYIILIQEPFESFFLDSFINQIFLVLTS